MIENIQIQTVASFGDAPEMLAGLSKFNFIYGANGTGKTTVSRAVADETRFPFCKVTWQGGVKLQTLVYNRDFIDRNFGQAVELKGIFTLGEKDKATLSNSCHSAGSGSTGSALFYPVIETCPSMPERFLTWQEAAKYGTSRTAH